MRNYIFIFIFLFFCLGKLYSDNNAQSDKHENTAYFVNDKFVDGRWIYNPDDISNIQVVSDSVMSVNGKTYQNQIYLRLNHDLALLSLSEIMDKYIPKKINNCIFIVNGVVLKEPGPDFLIDDSFILSVNSDQVNELVLSEINNDVEINIISIKTKTKENLEKQEKEKNTIRIR